MWHSVTIGWWRSVLALAAGVCVLWGSGAHGGLPGGRETVELFAGMQEGQLDVKVFPRDSRESRLLVANKSDRPIRVALPEVFAAVPILAQFDVNPAIPPDSDKVPQTLSMSPQNNQPGMFPGDNRMFNNMFFNLEPERTLNVKLRCACLEFGKADPNPRIAYQIKPLEAVIRKPGVAAVCRLLAGDTDQKAIQAAVWHLNNGLSWEDLKRKHYKSDFGPSKPIFTSRQLKEGRRLAEAALEPARPASTASLARSPGS